MCSSFDSSNAYPRLCPPVTRCEPLHLIWHQPTCRFSILPPPAPPRPSSTPPVNQRLTGQHRLWSQNGIWIGHPAALGLLTHSLSSNNMHTRTRCPPVCEREILWLLICFFFFKSPWLFDWLLILIVSALLCTAWTIRVIVTKSSRKDFMELTVIPLSLASSKCKKSASVFQLTKPQ